MTASRLLPLAALLAACGAAAPSPRTVPPAPAARPAPGVVLRGSVVRAPSLAAEGALAGRLAVGWYTADEWRSERGISMRTLIDLPSRLVVVRDADLTAPDARVPFELRVPPGDYVVFAMLDRRGAFLPMLFGSGGEGNVVGDGAQPLRVGPGATRPIEVPLRLVVRAPPRPERCQGERTTLVRLPSPEPDDGRGPPAPRRLCVYVPASYEAATARRYPVVYLLPGLMSTDTAYLARTHAGRMADLRAAEGGREAIVVGVDTSSRFGSTYFEDSPVTGPWESFLVRDVVDRVDGTFRTLPTGEARALVGHSTGGFNAVSVALRHPDVFSVVASSAPDALDLPAWLLGDDGRARPTWLAWLRVEDAMGGPGQFASYAADWSPEPASPRRFAWPVDLATGAPVPAVWSRWLARSPSTLLRDPATLARVRARLAGRIYLTAGRADEAGLFAPTEAFSRALTAAGVAHTFAPTERGHTDDFDQRLGAMLSFALGTLPPPRP